VCFSVQLGTRVDPGTVTEQWLPIVALSLFVLLGNPAIEMTIMGSLGCRRRVAFKAGLHVAQISESSLILVALGVAQGHIGSDLLGVVTVIGVVTIALSTEMIHNADRLLRRLDRPLALFERRRQTNLVEPRTAADRPEYLIIGVGRLGTAVLDDLLARGDRVLGLDFDLRGVKRTRWELPIVDGDADDPDLPTQLPLEATRWVIITVRDVPTDLHLTRSLRAHGYERGIAVAADHPDQCAMLNDAGATVTFRPFHLAAGPLVDAVLDGGAAP
jgi:voltage-gated potassium channel Kch